MPKGHTEPDFNRIIEIKEREGYRARRRMAFIASHDLGVAVVIFRFTKYLIFTTYR